jgi:hypothetical protein
VTVNKTPGTKFQEPNKFQVPKLKFSVLGELVVCNLVFVWILLFVFWDFTLLFEICFSLLDLTAQHFLPFSNGFAVGRIEAAYFEILNIG